MRNYDDDGFNPCDFDDDDDTLDRRVPENENYYSGRNGTYPHDVDLNFNSREYTHNRSKTRPMPPTARTMSGSTAVQTTGATHMTVTGRKARTTKGSARYRHAQPAKKRKRAAQRPAPYLPPLLRWFWWWPLPWAQASTLC